MSKEESKEKTPTVTGVAQRNVGHRFQLNHPRYGGKRKNSTQAVRDLCAEMDCDPMRFMLEIIKTGVTTQVVIENGKKKKIEVVADLATRTDLAKYVSRFIFPTLSATATHVTGEVDIQETTVDLTALLSDPARAAALQDLAFAVCEAEAAALDAESGPAPKLLEAHFTDDDSN